MTSQAPATYFPPLRGELAIFPGPTASDGAPTWTLHDPVRHLFFRIDHAVFEVISRWGTGTSAAIAEQIRQETPLSTMDEDSVFMVARFLSHNQLLRAVSPQDTARLLARHKEEKIHWAKWLLHHYLFFRVPLARPDRFLTRCLSWVEPFYRPAFRWLLAGTLLFGVFLLSRQWDRFIHTLVLTMTWDGMFAYGITLSLIKVLHEFGHAVTAKRFGCRIPTMGVAFLVMWPVPYTDTTEVWKLADHHQRLLVAAAGMITESALAIFALLAWSLLPDGTGRQMAFMVCTTALFSTLLINLSPFMRFDGYFILSDRLQIHNLHARAFALARWWLRERLFALGDPLPEVFSPVMRRGLILFALATWVYRVVVFLGIAALVYHFFIKVVGIFLFAVEIGWFLVLPVLMEMLVWWKRRGDILVSPHRSFLLIFLSIALLIVLLPWHTRISAPALLAGHVHTVLYAPGPGLLMEMPKTEGQQVHEGELLFRLDSPDLDQQQQQNTIRRQVLVREWSSVGVNADLREHSQVLRQDLETNLTEKIGLEREANRYHLLAPFAGRLVDLTPDLHTGQWISAKERLGAVLARGPRIIHAYLTEEDLAPIQPGDTGTFIPEMLDRPSLPCRVKLLDRSSVRVLEDADLASIHGGPISVREQGEHQLIPEQSVYRLTLEVQENADAVATIRQPGVIHLNGPAHSLVERLFKAVMAVLIRESGW